MPTEDGQHGASFDDVLRDELEQISKSREARLTENRQEEWLVDQQLVGLALSGGGVRSAIFSLGVLQGLARFGLLRRLDYLSSTGGGGEIAAWLMRWIHARGFPEVEKELSGKESPTIEAPEIQTLRRSIAFAKRRSISIAVLTIIRNVAFNLLALAALLGAAIFLARIILTILDGRIVYPGEYITVTAITAVVLAVLSFTRSPNCPPTQLRTVLILFVLSIFACFLIGAERLVQWRGTGFDYSQWLILSGIAIAFFCLILGFPRPFLVKNLLAHLASAVGVGAVAAAALMLISTIPVWPESSPYLGFYGLQSEQLIQLVVSLVILLEALSLLLYGLLTKKWSPRGTRELIWRVCRTLLGFTFIWLTVVLTWMVPFWLAALGIVVAGVSTGLALGKVAGLMNPKSSVAKFSFDMMERVAPYSFVIGMTGLVAIGLKFFTQNYTDTNRLLEVLVALSLALIGMLLLWLIKARQFTTHRAHRSRIIRNYLEPAASSVPDVSAGDVGLGSLAELSAAGSPYPLFGAALDVAEVARDSFAQLRPVAFLFSPLFSGFELPRKGDQKVGVAEAYRPTQRLGGGISLATAAAISQPVRGKSFRPQSGASAMLWTMFGMCDGRFMGNPTQNDSWREHGPLLEPLYALRSVDLPSEARYVRPLPSDDFDNLGIYQLVKRHCRFIICCDATRDPDFEFRDLGKTILRCRTELGADIQMDLGPLGRTPSSSTAHCQIARIRYSSGEDGLMVYIKPSLTGDEPLGLVQYARTHSDFPTTDLTEGRFGEADFENYRGLGEHIVQSLLDSLQINAEMPTNQVFRLITRQIQPDFKEPERTSAREAEATIPIPQDLVDAIATGECVLCAGSGLAAQAKLPTWPAFLNGLLRIGRESGVLDAASASGLHTTLAAGDVEAAADELVHQLPRELLVEEVRSFTAGAEPSEAHEILAQMKFLGALNLNIDDLLAAAFYTSRTIVPAESEKLVAALQAKNFFALNLFGSASEPSSLLFTMKEFRQSLLANSQLKQFLGTLFLRYTVVFIGLSLDGIRDFIEALELIQTPERKHFAIIPNTGAIDPVKVRFFERSFNIRVVDYQPQFNFTGLPEFLNHLKSEIKENAPQPKATEPLTLKSITVENIGPFHSLHLDFTSQWNLLLGDNGVGKTVLLKAIAAALCGKKAPLDSVSRLLRVGAQKGSIKLRDENREYSVGLERQTDGSVLVTSASLSPIIHDRWLVLGFPALRSITMVRPKGPRPLKLKDPPSAEDLLPLLSGEPDERVTDIKQWLVNLDYAIKSGDTLGRAKKLMHDFFSVLRLLTPGLRLEQGTIDSNTMEIKVVTDSGAVPLEFLSQGTGAVMCWIGSLLERLSETGNTRDANVNSALVLIDELDAHMHPKWQQLFVDAFRKEFKAVQIIATTHSPLLVSSLKPEEIWLVHRDPLRAEIDGIVQLGEVIDGKRQITVLGAEEEPQDGQPPSLPDKRTYSLPATTELLVEDGEPVDQGEPLTKAEIRVVAERVMSKEDGWRADQILTSPLFELETTRDPETANMLKEYDQLTIMEDQSEAVRQRLAELARKLNIRLPTPLETEAARKAFGLISEFATQRLEALPATKRRKVLDEVKVQLTESITGSERSE